jgi:hypothetical protein
MSATSPPTSGTDIWRRTIQPAKRTLDPSAARALLELRLSAHDQRRAGLLAEKAGTGRISAAEAQEVETYRSISTALEFLKSKARRSLAPRR